MRVIKRGNYKIVESANFSPTHGAGALNKPIAKGKPVTRHGGDV